MWQLGVMPVWTVCGGRGHALLYGLHEIQFRAHYWGVKVFTQPIHRVQLRHARLGTYC